MMVLLSKSEYDALVQKATATELLAEQKAEAMKADLKRRLLEFCRSDPHGCTPSEMMIQLFELLQQY